MDRWPLRRPGLRPDPAPNGLELLFCAHHNRQHSSALTKIAVGIHDETDRLARPAA